MTFPPSGESRLRSSGACPNPDKPNGTTCDFDGLPGECESGLCVGLCSGVDCDDGNDCTLDSCDATSGFCDNIAVADGSLCANDSATCVAGRCMFCDPNPCLNGGTCSPVLDSFVCSCVGGYTGDFCEIATESPIHTGTDSSCVGVGERFYVHVWDPDTPIENLRITFSHFGSCGGSSPAGWSIWNQTTFTARFTCSFNVTGTMKIEDESGNSITIQVPTTCF